MKNFTKSLVLGITTILVWVYASLELNNSKEIITNNIIVENIDNSLSETLTMDYKDTTN